MEIGIITFYYKNYNYGGILQACALQYYFEDKGYDCQQIVYENSSKTSIALREKIVKSAKYGLCHLLVKIGTAIERKMKYKISHVLQKFFLPEYSANFREWCKCLDNFIQVIPHTKEVYDYNTISQCNQIFDCFVCGSDQIWNPLLANPYIYALGFVETKKKISYASSIAKDKLSNEEWDKLCLYVKELDFISVREKNILNILSKKIKKDVSIVLDPTLLLRKNQWEKVKIKYKNYSMISDLELDNEKYIFIYLLGDNKKHRKAIKRFAQKNSLKIVYIPYALPFSFSGHISDNNFGDYRLRDINPMDFIHIIESAEFVITDSFHATVFSIMYHINFYVLQRSIKKGNMNSRLDTLLEDAGLQERLLPFHIKNIRKTVINEKEWMHVDKRIEQLRCKSIQFLERALSFD